MDFFNEHLLPNDPNIAKDSIRGAHGYSITLDHRRQGDFEPTMH